MKYLKMSRLDYGASAFLMIYAASAVATPICLIILLKEMDLSLSEGGSIEAVRALLLLGILLYSGIAASRWGKPAVLIAGGFILTGGLFFYGLAPSYFFILAAMTLVGLGGGVLEALINPLIQDLHPENSGAYLNVVNAFFSIGVLGTVLVTGELLTRGATWRMIFLGLGVLSLGVTLFFLSGTLGKASKKSVVSRNEGNPLVHARTLLKKRRFWVFALAMVCGGGVESAYTFWTASFIQMSYGTAPRAGALGTAIFASGMIAGRIAGGLIRQSRIFYQILVSSLAGLLISLGFFPDSESDGAVFSSLSCRSGLRLFLAKHTVLCGRPDTGGFYHAFYSALCCGDTRLCRDQLADGMDRRPLQSEIVLYSDPCSFRLAGDNHDF